MPPGHGSARLGQSSRPKASLTLLLQEVGGASHSNACPGLAKSSNEPRNEARMWGWPSESGAVSSSSYGLIQEGRDGSHLLNVDKLEREKSLPVAALPHGFAARQRQHPAKPPVRLLTTPQSGSLPRTALQTCFQYLPVCFKNRRTSRVLRARKARPFGVGLSKSMTMPIRCLGGSV